MKSVRVLGGETGTPDGSTRQQMDVSAQEGQTRRRRPPSCFPAAPGTHFRDPRGLKPRVPTASRSHFNAAYLGGGGKDFCLVCPRPQRAAARRRAQMRGILLGMQFGKVTLCVE